MARFAAAQANPAAAAAAAGRPAAPTTSKSAHGAIKAAGSAAVQATGAPAQAIEAIPAKKAGPGRKRKSMDQRMPDRGDLLIPDSALFTQLQDAERRVDMLISRKKHELQEMYASFRRGGCCVPSRWCTAHWLLTQARRGTLVDAGPPGSAQAAGSVRRKLRVYVRSEHQHQQNAADAAEPPSWVLTVSGRIVGKDKVADKALDAGACP